MKVDNMERIPVLNDGFVQYIDHMGDDSAVAQAARVSYGAGTKSVSDDEHLIRYLMRHRHTTPLEMVEFKFLVRVPMDCWRQWIRHRTASVNEYSTRYSEAIDSCYKVDTWRKQSKGNKQGSEEGEFVWNDIHPECVDGRWVVKYGIMGTDIIGFDHEPTVQEFLTAIEERGQQEAQRMYALLRSFDVSRELARKDLPLSTYTEAYWKIDLHNLMHFLSLRLDSHAQYEIRMYAEALATIVKQIVPICWSAFEDYRLKAVTLSALDIVCLRTGGKPEHMSDREYREFEEKVKMIYVYRNL